MAFAVLANDAQAQRLAAGAHDARIASYSAAYGVPQALIRRVIKIESGGNPRVVSKGNYGLMQIRLGTARAMGYAGSAEGLLDADVNMAYAVKYLAGAYRAAGGDENRAVAYYQKGYYYQAKAKGFSPYAKPAQVPVLASTPPTAPASAPAPLVSAPQPLPPGRPAPAPIVEAQPAPVVALESRWPTPRGEPKREPATAAVMPQPRPQVTADPPKAALDPPPNVRVAARSPAAEPPNNTPVVTDVPRRKPVRNRPSRHMSAAVGAAPQPVQQATEKSLLEGFKSEFAATPRSSGRSTRRSASASKGTDQPSLLSAIKSIIAPDKPARRTR